MSHPDIDRLYAQLRSGQSSATLRRVPITAADAVIVSAVLQAAPRILRVSFIGCDITAAILDALLPGLRACPALSYLNLDGNPIGDEGLALLATWLATNPKLERLGLKHCGIARAGIVRLLAAFPANTVLQALAFDANAVPRGALRAVMHAVAVNTIAAAATRLRQEHHRRNHILELVGTPLRPSSAGAVVAAMQCAAPGTRVLSLTDCEVSGNVLRALVTALAADPPCALSCLRLNGNTLDETDAGLLGAWLATDPPVTDICLENCGLSGLGVDCLLATFPANTRLCSMSLVGNAVPTHLLRSLHRAICRNQIASHCQRLQSDDPTLTDIGLDGWTRRAGQEFFDAIGPHLRCATRLTKLSIADSELSASGVARLLANLAHNRSLLEVWLDRNPVGDEALSHLVEWLAANPPLRCLRITNCGIDAGAIIWLLAGLASNTNLTLICLDDVTLPRATREPLFQRAGVACFRQECARVIAGERLWELSTRHVSPYLRHVRVGDDAARLLGQALAVAKAVTSVVLDSGGISDEGLHSVVAGLQTNFTVKTLILRNNTITDVGAAVLASWLATNPPLESLDLIGCPIGPAGLQHISAALETCTNLKSILCEQLFSSTIVRRDISLKLAHNRMMACASLAVSHVDQDGRAPMHLLVEAAGRVGGPDVFFMMVARGHRLLVRNKLGDTPLHCAARSNLFLCAAMLQHCPPRK
eukprot:m.115636 g.115636  ORF g.115636 m.115636 type:complete len:706 (+) comp9170_c1_seq2:39-2156(+)